MTVLARLQWGDATPRIGIVEDGLVHLTYFESLLDWFEAERTSWAGISLDWDQLLRGSVEGYRVLAPLAPPEVWGYGFTYERGSQFTTSPVIPTGAAYEHAIASGRPEIFFKTTAWRVVGPEQEIGIRGDAGYTAAEAELCVIIDGDARPILFTAGNDVSAWDIEARNPLWLAQGKTYESCCSLGPVAVTRDELRPNAEIRCRISRSGEPLFEGSNRIDRMHWSFDELAQFAAAFNPLPPGTVLMTGTGIVRPDAESLVDGDIVEISIEGIGVLRNRAAKLSSPVPYRPYE